MKIYLTFWTILQYIIFVHSVNAMSKKKKNHLKWKHLLKKKINILCDIFKSISKIIKICISVLVSNNPFWKFLPSTLNNSDAKNYHTVIKINIIYHLSLNAYRFILQFLYIIIKSKPATTMDIDCITRCKGYRKQNGLCSSKINIHYSYLIFVKNKFCFVQINYENIQSLWFISID